MTPRKKILFINSIPSAFESASVSKSIGLAPSWYAYLGALTPDYYEIDVLDENVSPFSFRTADLVGLSVLTTNAPRCYEIAKIYRDKKIPVVFGGVHATVRKQEALEHADAVVLGEAENVWAKLLDDWEHGQLQKTYRGGFPSLSGIIPKRNLIPKEYGIASISTSRGCPFGCEFCSVTSFNGAKIRFRPIESVIEELRKISQSQVFFLDDNVVPPGQAGRAHAKALFGAMINAKVNKVWIGQSTMHFGLDEEIVRLAQRSGCKMISMGIESFNDRVLSNYKKHFHRTEGDHGIRIRKSIENFHKYGISVKANFILGNDGDTAESYRNIAKSISNLDIDVPLLTVLTAYPGTPIFERFSKNHRLIYSDAPNEWKWYDGERLTIKPLDLSLERQLNRIASARREVYRLKAIAARSAKNLFLTGSFRSALITLRMNLQYRSAMRQKILSDGI